MENVQLARFDIDVEALIRDTALVKQNIDAVRESQKILTKENKTSSEEYVRNVAELKQLNKEYGSQTKVLGEVLAAQGKVIPLEHQLNTVLNQQVKSINDLRKQNQELTKIRNNVNLENEEGQKQIKLINDRLDENNGLIKENVAGFEQNKMSVGAYTESIREAFAGTGLFNQTSKEMNETLGVASGVFKTASQEVKTAVSEIIAADSATKLFNGTLKLLKVALVATGVGAIVVLLGSLIAYISSSEQASNKFSKVLKTLGGVVQQLLKYLYPLGEFLLDTIVKAFDFAGQAAQKFASVVSSSLSFLGFDNAAKSVDKFSASLSKAAADSAKLADAEAKLTQQERNARTIMLQYQKEAEKLRQIRDDESRSTNERIAANEKLGAKLQEQMKVELDIANQRLDNAKLAIQLQGATGDNLDKEAEALQEIADIEERITGQQSEQLTNRNSLIRDAQAAAKEAAEAAKTREQERISRLNDELELYKVRNSGGVKTLEDQNKLENDFANRRIEILKQELKSKLISQTQYDTEVAKFEQERLNREASIAQEAFDRTLSDSENRIELERSLSEAVGKARLEEEKKWLKETLDARLQYAEQMFNAELITEKQYSAEVAEINRQNIMDNAQIEREQREALREEKMESMSFSMQQEIAALEALSQESFSVQQRQIELQRELDLEAARQRYTDEALLQQAILTVNTQANTAQIELAGQRDKVIADSKMNLLNAIANMLGQETVLGKAAAIAQATMNSYLGVTNALATLPPPASFITAAATLVTGLSAVGKIVGIGTGTNKVSVPQTSSNQQSSNITSGISLNTAAPFATGGLVTGGIPIKRSNGDNVLATLKKGEVVLNEKQQKALGGNKVFRQIGVPGFASGGLVGSIPTVQNTITQNIESGMIEAIESAVRRGARAGTQQGSREGIVDTSTENYIRRMATK